MLLCFSHLRWDFVWQRPQHLLTRFARRMDVLVVEEPVFEPGPAALRCRADHGVTVATPVLPDEDGLPDGFNEETNPRIRALLAAFLADGVPLTRSGAATGTPTGTNGHHHLNGAAGTVGKRNVAAAGVAVAANGNGHGGNGHGFAANGNGRDRLGVPAAGPILWYYTPMALGAEPAGLDPALVVFDAMDELAAFRFAPPALVEREAALMTAADLVFTGGPSLYRARRHRHPAVHCFPSGVEADHFAQALRPERRHPELAAAPRPIVGFYGVIDERLDLDLIADVAAARPDWTLAMVGPVAKLAPEELPQAPNIRYFGKRPYADLPAFLACFDVAILPFARNEATRFISPTKTLEYLAGGKRVVSTPIADVVDLYGEVVTFGESPEDFVFAIEKVLDEPAATRVQLRQRAQAVLARHAWDTVASEMLALMDQALARKRPLPLAVAPLAADAFAATGAA